MVTDNGWVNMRQRALSVYTVVEADEGDKNRLLLVVERREARTDCLRLA